MNIKKLRWYILTWFVLAVTTPLSACSLLEGLGPVVPTPTITPVTFQEGFEAGLDTWVTGADVPDDPNRPGYPVAWSIEVSGEQFAEGAKSAKFFLDGLQDDGTIWLARPFNVPASSDLIMSLSFAFWSETESFNTLAKVAAYAGARGPEGEEDFDLEQPANQVDGWKRYTYRFNVRSDDKGQMWVALGISVI